MSQEVVAYYLNEAQKFQSSDREIAKIQELAREALTKRGFPTRHDEDWKYVSLRDFLEYRFKAGVEEEPRRCEELATKQSSTMLLKTSNWIASPSARKDGKDTYQINIINGQVADLSELQKTLPNGVQIHSLAEVMASKPQAVTQFLQQTLDLQQSFSDLNTLFLAEGIFIEILPGVTLDKPIFINHSQNKANNAAYTRNLVLLHESASASIIEVFESYTNTRYFTNTLTQIDLAAKSNLVHYTLQCESSMSFHICKLLVRQAQASTFYNHVMQYGGQLARSDITVMLLEPEASCNLNGIYTPRAIQQMDHVLKVQHLAPQCDSNQNYKGVLTDKSRGVFNGSIHVANTAQKTRAHQSNQNILMSPEAEVDTKPQLDIFADDVVCSHGATVGYLDKEALFYLTARGLTLSQARQYLIRGFLSTNIREIPHQQFRDTVENLIGENNE